MMRYKGYSGAVTFDDEAGLFHGEVVDMRDVVTFQGASVDELRQAFQDSIDDYLDFCTERGEVPDKPFSGSFPVRVSPDLHRRAMIEARNRGISLNALMAELLERETRQGRGALNPSSPPPAHSPAPDNPAGSGFSDRNARPR